MKIWPIIALGALLYGGMYADGMNTGRESAPHPRHHGLTELDAELAADMKAFDPPHRPVTMAYREFFAKLLAEEHDWSTPESKALAATAEADADDGEDPGKKLFWKTVYPKSDPTLFPGWGDPNPPHEITYVAQPLEGLLPPGFEIVFITDEPLHESDSASISANANANAASEASTHATFGNLPFGALQALTNLTVTKDSDGVTSISVTPCLTTLVNGVCSVPCSALTASLPSCDMKKKDDPSLPLVPPLAGLPTGPTSPSDPSDPIINPVDPVVPIGPIIGGGGVGGLGATIPEPSTWLMLITGFAALSWLGWRRRFY